MITVKSSVEISGEHVTLSLEGAQVKLLAIRAPPNLTAIHVNAALKSIMELRDELQEAIDSLRACSGGTVKQLVFEPADLTTVFESIEALNSNEARHIALRKFYSVKENENLVLIVKSCPRVGDLPDGRGNYQAIGFTRPRQKRLKGTLAPVEKTEAPASDEGVR